MLCAVDWMVLAGLDCFTPGYRENMFPLEGKPKACEAACKGKALPGLLRPELSTALKGWELCASVAKSFQAALGHSLKLCQGQPSLARAWLWLLVTALVLGKQRGVRAPSSLEDSGMLGSCGKSWSLSIMRVDEFRATNWLSNE